MLTCALRTLFKQAESRSFVLNYQKIENIIFQQNISVFFCFLNGKIQLNATTCTSRTCAHKTTVQQIYTTEILNNKN